MYTVPQYVLLLNSGSVLRIVGYITVMISSIVNIRLYFSISMITKEKLSDNSIRIFFTSKGGHMDKRMTIFKLFGKIFRFVLKISF